ncbi:3-hydroxyacyl-ACP dehydratase FabZ family protein [Flavobacterium caeni]|uniref:3-hydroxyacyl-[acyl-carrier-protein] dehydratase n=1 Tax=Flavobacterium caeni TaxID=490189 RepID=A0A1G5D9L2_9FLAO|nr:3-hydroxyacyl-ACP dehydratase FabZ family protein [Flavobacterium caeni]SCY11130.1 3-hydroxyacyl-[acyl-carrier-protein] dehydratase [Flavobacterium caeni]
MVKNNDQILEKLPYGRPFLFVDAIESIDENGVRGHYTLDKDADFYKGHFKGHPVTPGVILTEIMAQIGVVCLGIFLLDDASRSAVSVALTSTQIEFLKPVYPGEKVTVVSQKKYFRFGKLKCTVTITNAAGIEVCTGEIAGMVVPKMQHHE